MSHNVHLCYTFHAGPIADARWFCAFSPQSEEFVPFAGAELRCGSACDGEAALSIGVCQ